MPRLFSFCMPFLAAASMLTAEAQSASPAGDSSDMPVISEEARKLILEGTWWDLNPTILPGLDEMEAALQPGQIQPTTMGDSHDTALPFPEDDKVLNQQFLPEYIKQAPLKIIDPQRLLAEVEREDMIKLIDALESFYSVKIFVSLFAPGQEIPPEVNVYALGRQILNPSEKSMLLHIHYGDITTLQITCNTAWMESMGDQGRRALLAKIKECASIYTDPQDSLSEAVAAMALFSQSDMLKPDEGKAPPPKGANVKVPEVNVELEEPEKKTSSHFREILQQIPKKLGHYATLILSGMGVLIALGAFYIWNRNTKPVKLISSESDRRLGAPYGAGVSRIVSYGDKDDSNPGSLQRRQMRDHLRDIT